MSKNKAWRATFAYVLFHSSLYSISNLLYAWETICRCNWPWCAEMLTFATRNPFDCCGECTLVQKNPFLAQAYKKDYSRCIFPEKEQQQLQKTRVSCCILLEMPLVATESKEKQWQKLYYYDLLPKNCAICVLELQAVGKVSIPTNTTSIQEFGWRIWPSFFGSQKRKQQQRLCFLLQFMVVPI